MRQRENERVVRHSPCTKCGLSTNMIARLTPACWLTATGTAYLITPAGPQGKGGVLATKAVETHTRGSVTTTKHSGKTQGKGGVSATKAVGSQMRCLLATKAVDSTRQMRCLTGRRREGVPADLHALTPDGVQSMVGPQSRGLVGRIVVGGVHIWCMDWVCNAPRARVRARAQRRRGRRDPQRVRPCDPKTCQLTAAVGTTNRDSDCRTRLAGEVADEPGDGDVVARRLRGPPVQVVGGVALPGRGLRVSGRAGALAREC